MTGEELAARRKAAGLTEQDLAGLLRRHVDEVRDLEASSRSLPRGLVRELDWHLAHAERDRALEQAGLPECPWVKERTRNLDYARVADVERAMNEVEAHVPACERCREREAFVANLPPLPPPPLSATMRSLAWLADRIGRLPERARPVAVGALIVAGMTLVRAVFFLLARGGNPAAILQSLGVVVLGGVGGAAGGWVYSIARGPLLRLGRVGPYALGVACVWATLLVLLGLSDLFSTDPMLRDPAGWVILLLLGLVLGPIVGHSLFRALPASSAKV